MAATPPAVTNTAQSIQPVFKRVQQKTDFDCAFACIATICGKSLDEVIQVAIDKFGHPKHGPYWITDELIAKIFMHYGFLSSVWKPVTKGIVDLPDVAICMISYDEATEVGRNTIFVRDQSNQKAIKQYIIDPAYWVESSMHVRSDFATMQPAWFVSVQPVVPKTAKAGK